MENTLCLEGESLASCLQITSDHRVITFKTLAHVHMLALTSRSHTLQAGGRAGGTDCHGEGGDR